MKTSITTYRYSLLVLGLSGKAMCQRHKRPNSIGKQQLKLTEFHEKTTLHKAISTLKTSHNQQQIASKSLITHRTTASNKNCYLLLSESSMLFKGAHLLPFFRNHVSLRKELQ